MDHKKLDAHRRQVGLADGDDLRRLAAQEGLPLVGRLGREPRARRFVPSARDVRTWYAGGTSGLSQTDINFTALLPYVLSRTK